MNPKIAFLICSCFAFIPAFVDCEDDSLLQVNMVEISKYAQGYIMKSMNHEWGWDSGNTPRAVVALALSNDTFFHCGDMASSLMEKQLQLELAGLLLRKNKTSVSSGQLAVYVMALKAICKDPHDFFHINLVSRARHLPVVTGFEKALKYLALCIGGHRLSKENMNDLSELLKAKPDSLHVKLDTEAMAVMAIACSSKRYQNTHVYSLLKESTSRFKQHQKDDGSFGNIYTTALVVQALIAIGDTKENWRFDRAIDYIKRQYEDPVVHLDLLSHYFVLPAVNMKSLADVQHINCNCTQITEGIEDVEKSTEIVDAEKSPESKDVKKASESVEVKKAPESVEVKKAAESVEVKKAPESVEVKKAAVSKDVMKPSENELRVILGMDKPESSSESTDVVPEIAVTYSLWHVCSQDTAQPVNISTVVFINEGDSFLNVMEKAARRDDRYLYTTKNTSVGLMIDTLAGVKNEAVNSTYWIIYQLEEPYGQLRVLDTGVANIIPKNNDHFVFWYQKM